MAHGEPAPLKPGSARARVAAGARRADGAAAAGAACERFAGAAAVGRRARVELLSAAGGRCDLFFDRGQLCCDFFVRGRHNCERALRLVRQADRKLRGGVCCQPGVQRAQLERGARGALRRQTLVQLHRELRSWLWRPLPRRSKAPRCERDVLVARRSFASSGGGPFLVRSLSAHGRAPGPRPHLRKRRVHQRALPACAAPRLPLRNGRQGDAPRADVRESASARAWGVGKTLSRLLRWDTLPARAEPPRVRGGGCCGRQARQARGGAAPAACAAPRSPRQSAALLGPAPLRRDDALRRRQRPPASSGAPAWAAAGAAAARRAKRAKRAAAQRRPRARRRELHARLRQPLGRQGANDAAGTSGMAAQRRAQEERGGAQRGT